MINIVKAHATIEHWPEVDVLKFLERIGRVCYKSEGKMCETSANTFIKSIMDRQHESVIEHLSATVRFVCDRGVSHELVRHRLASFTQESTRYCNYTKDGFNNQITVIEPPGLEPMARMSWLTAMDAAARSYQQMIFFGVKPQIARGVLPNSLKTEIVVTANFREWRHIFKQRCAPAAHPQMREVMVPLLAEFQARAEVIFGGIEV